MIHHPCPVAQAVTVPLKQISRPPLTVRIASPFAPHAADRMSQEAADRTGLPHPGPTHLECRNLCYAVRDTPIIQSLDLHVPVSGITAIIGPNGAGKTVLLKLLHGLLEPGSGEIRWGGVRAGKGTMAGQAMVFQRPVLLRRSVKANLDLVIRGPGHQAVIAAIMDELQITRLARRPARSLSGGEQQRLALARALLLGRPVLLCDEPCANLDPDSIGLIEGTLRRRAQCGMAIFLVTHNLAQARRIADRIVFMHDGAVHEVSDTHAFFENPRDRRAAGFIAGHLIQAQDASASAHVQVEPEEGVL